MRTLTPPARIAAFSPETNETFLVLLVITDAGIEGNVPMRFVNNVENIWSRAHGEDDAQEYIAWPFTLSLPDERADQVIGARLQIDNVDPQIMGALRGLVAPPLLTLYVIVASSPDEVEAGPFEGRLASVDYNAQTITATVRGPGVLGEPFPWRIFNPTDWPGVF